jgi:hypothetical protein
MVITKKLAAGLIVVTMAMGVAQAAIIKTKIAYGADNATNAHHAFLEGSFSFVTEDFNTASNLGLASFVGQDTGNDGLSWIDSATSYNTRVGTFTIASGDGDIAAPTAENPHNLMIESSDTGEFGRQTDGVDGDRLVTDFWLDSNDATEVSWNFSGIGASFDSLGFFIVDANDSNAQLQLNFLDGTNALVDVLKLANPLSNGNIAYISLFSSEALLGASLIFENNGRNDGWAIDNVTVAKVPEPTAIAILGLGLISLFAMRKR